MKKRHRKPSPKVKAGRKPEPIEVAARGLAVGTTFAGARARRAAPKRGRASGWPFVVEEAIQRLQGPDKATYIRQGRPNFLKGLEKWLPKAHPDVRPMVAKTIGDHLRRDDNVRALMPEDWKRRR